MNAAVFNTYRRSRGQVMYFVPWGFALYFIIDWAEKRYVLILSEEKRFPREIWRGREGKH